MAKTSPFYEIVSGGQLITAFVQGCLFRIKETVRDKVSGNNRIAGSDSVVSL